MAELTRPIQIKLSPSNPKNKADKKDNIHQKPETNEDNLITKNFETSFYDSLEAILGIENFIGVISVLASEFEQVQSIEYFKEDCFDAFLGRECLFLDDNLYGRGIFEHPTKVTKSHLQPLHIKAMVEGWLMNLVLVDGGVAINSVPKSMLGKLGNMLRDLVQTNVAVTDFNGKTSTVKGVVLLNIRVGSVDRHTMFVVVPSKVSYNLPLGRDWIHGVSAIPSTLHQRMILSNKDVQIEEIEPDDSNCYYKQLLVDFKMYNQRM